MGVDKIREYLSYDPESGVFTWLKTRNNHAIAGSRAGYVNFEIEENAARAYDAAATCLHDLEIPERFFESLAHAVTHKFEALEDGGMNPIPREVPLYPFQVLVPTEFTERLMRTAA